MHRKEVAPTDYDGFYAGQEFEAYRYLGAHISANSVVFRTFAPNAQKISVIGSFNDWNEAPMTRVYDGNFWECKIENAKQGALYKYRIWKKDGTYTDHCDPYGFFAEIRPNTASIVYSLSGYSFQDHPWINHRADMKDSPLNIYEIHCGSWRRKSNSTNGFYSYRELSDLLIPYLKENGYNYIELMPLNEHPCDSSWGYQSTGFFSPTSRYGTPDDLRYFVDQCHLNNIGVILDFIPVHFAVDDYALWNYDGTALYEYPNNDVGISEWGSCNFMHSRGEVRSFLQSAAYYWLKEFHFGGLRMDAVNNLIYWQGDPARGKNNAAIKFLQNMNSGIKRRIPSALLIAEDSSSYPGITKPVNQSGLGFDYKWDLGWMNDTLSYFQSAPEQRTFLYHKLTFSMQYFYNENYLLPLSHDEVVHGKATIIQKMNGNYSAKFKQARAFYMYMFAHPGKKLNFMGNEIGQLREWDEKREQDWDLLCFQQHDSFYRFMQDLSSFYLNNPAFSENDYSREGFVWLDCHQEARCIYAFERRCKNQRIVAIFNFSNNPYSDYMLTISDAESLKLVFSSEDGYSEKHDHQNPSVIRLNSHMDKFTVSLLPFSGQFYIVES
jgi:1,4-alpha-glucan branching enzyme